MWYVRSDKYGANMCIEKSRMDEAVIYNLHTYEAVIISIYTRSHYNIYTHTKPLWRAIMDAAVREGTCACVRVCMHLCVYIYTCMCAGQTRKVKMEAENAVHTLCMMTRIPGCRQGVCDEVAVCACLCAFMYVHTCIHVCTHAYMYDAYTCTGTVSRHPL
jgi:hypothetical protein